MLSRVFQAVVVWLRLSPESGEVQVEAGPKPSLLEQSRRRRFAAGSSHILA
jgi:hypothetical protein